MRTQWNSAALRKHCQNNGQRLYICDAEDVVGKDHQPPNLEQRTVIAGVHVGKLDKLPHRTKLAIGMKCMITANISTDADLANGSRGTIADIILDAREIIDETAANEKGYVKLQYPPATIIFEAYHHSFPKPEGLKEGQIPLFPQNTNFQISTVGKPNTKVYRRQYALTAAYVFTDYKAQGQTIENVIIDIRPVPGNFKITLFGVYVALSRSRGRETIRLLRDFDENLFTRHPSEDLRLEDIRLEDLTRATVERFNAGYYN